MRSERNYQREAGNGISDCWLPQKRRVKPFCSANFGITQDEVIDEIRIDHRYSAQRNQGFNQDSRRGLALIFKLAH
jgi:hypothetical protein